jgi:hypothetical protein
MASPTPKKIKLAAEQSDIDSPTPVRRKGRQIPHEEYEDDEDVTAPINNSPIKTKAKPTSKPQRKLVNAPAELPLKAPINTLGIPNDALAIGEFFKKTPRLLLEFNCLLTKLEPSGSGLPTSHARPATPNSTGQMRSMSKTSIAGVDSESVVASLSTVLWMTVANVVQTWRVHANREGGKGEEIRMEVRRIIQRKAERKAG